MSAPKIPLWLPLVALCLFIQKASAEDPKVYFDDKCLKFFSTHRAPDMGENETKVEEHQGSVSFRQTVVFQTQSDDEGPVRETLIRIDECRPSPTPTRP